MIRSILSNNRAMLVFAVLFGLVGVVASVSVHDFAWFCPRIALLGAGDRYCGEPAPEACDACVAAMGSYLNETIATAALIARSAEILVAARRVIAPSGDAAARMTRHFPGLPIAVVPHDDDDAIDPPPPSRLAAGPVRICVVGGIGLHKGFFVLLACARDAARRRLKLEFTVVGSTIDDRALLDTGRVFVTGPYQPEEAVTLIRAQDAAMGFVPSICPETWCLVLTELWRAGLRAAAFDIGAPADRIRQTGHGIVLPVAYGASAINDALIAAARGRSLLPIRRSSAYKPPHECNPE